MKNHGYTLVEVIIAIFMLGAGMAILGLIGICIHFIAKFW